MAQKHKKRRKRSLVYSKKEKSPRTLTRGSDVCRAIFALFFAFLCACVEKIEKNRPFATSKGSVFQSTDSIPKVDEVACGVDAEEDHKHVSQNKKG